MYEMFSGGNIGMYDLFNFLFISYLFFHCHYFLQVQTEPWGLLKRNYGARVNWEGAKRRNEVMEKKETEKLNRL